MLKILWKRGKIAPEEQFLPLSAIFCYLILDFYVLTRTRFFLRDKRLFEITEVEITRVDCNIFSDRTMKFLIFWTFLPLVICLLSESISKLCECEIQSTLVISKSKGPAETLRDIRTSTYQMCRIEENTKRTTKFHT